MKLQFLVPAVMAGMMLFSTSCKKDDNKETVKEVLPKVDSIHKGNFLFC